MRETQLSLPELAMVAGTRAMLGAGLALLLGDRLPTRERKVFGWTLLAVGLASTIPLAIDVLGQSRRRDMAASEWEPEREMTRTPERVHVGIG